MDILEIRKLTPEFTYPVLWSVSLYQAGQRERARRVLARAVLADPTNSTAWLWLGRCLDDPDQKQECRERVRLLDERRNRKSVGHACSVTHPSQRTFGKLSNGALCVILGPCLTLHLQYGRRYA